MFLKGEGSSLIISFCIENLFKQIKKDNSLLLNRRLENSHFER